MPPGWPLHNGLHKSPTSGGYSLNTFSCELVWSQRGGRPGAGRAHLAMNVCLTCLTLHAVFVCRVPTLLPLSCEFFGRTSQGQPSESSAGWPELPSPGCYPCCLQGCDVKRERLCYTGQLRSQRPSAVPIPVAMQYPRQPVSMAG